MAVPARTAALLGPAQSVGLLIAEGDSWFDYPLHDVLEMLEDEHGFDVESVAHRGDRIEDMAYSGGQFEEFARRLEKVLRQGRVPDAILLSGGGNDLADQLTMLLNYAASGLPTVNADIARGLIAVRLRDAFAFLIAGLSAIAQRHLARPIPILVHGYDHAVPDGRGVLGGFGPLPGPWLEPGFHRKGHGDLARNTKVVADLLDAFNDMLAEVSGAFDHVRFVDLRGTLSAGRDYRRDWANELHPTKRGFSAVASRIAAAVAAL